MRSCVAGWVVQYISRVKGSKKNSRTLQTLKTEGTVFLSKCQETLNQQHSVTSHKQWIPNSKVHYLVHKSLPSVPILTKIHPVHTTKTHTYCNFQPDPGNSLVFPVWASTPTFKAPSPWLIYKDCYHQNVQPHKLSFKVLSLHSAQNIFMQHTQFLLISKQFNYDQFWHSVQ